MAGILPERPSLLVNNGEDASDDIFTTFKQNSKIYKKLVKGFVHVTEGLSRMNVRCMKIKWTDAMHVQPFSNAICITEPQGDPFIIDVLFDTGMEVLNRFIHDDLQGSIPEDLGKKTALQNLLVFFRELHEIEPFHDFFETRKFKSELEWTVVVAEHLLCKLAGQNYTINRFSLTKDVLVSDEGVTGVCPCPKHEKISGTFGDTSFGIENGLHGTVDILVSDTPVQVTPHGFCDVEDETRSPECTGAATEIKQTVTFSRDNRMQLMSECIVHSFLQRKIDNTLKTCLIPAIGLGEKELQIVFYDSENDILLSTDMIELEDIHRQGELKPAVVVLLWLTLNHKLFCSGVPNRMRGFKANFDGLVEDKIISYRDDVKRGVNKIVDIDDIGWADIPGKKLKTR